MSAEKLWGDLAALPGNDREAAVALAKKFIEANAYDPSVAEALINAQDDPEELIDDLNKLLEG